MISLEGPVPPHGAVHRAARWILRTFASYVRNGSSPTCSPRARTGAYQHDGRDPLVIPLRSSVPRYTSEVSCLRELMQLLELIVNQHVTGRASASRPTPRTACSRQGRGWLRAHVMEAKCDDGR